MPDSISQLFTKDIYLNRSKLSLFNKEIIEYDMSDAGYSIIREHSLLPQKTIENLSHKSKRDRTYAIGRIQGKDKEFAQRLHQGFQDARELFFKLNNIQDDDILSVKKDAIFTLRQCDHQQIGNYINFREKHNYSSYVYTGRLEIYYRSTMSDNPIIDIKGIDDDKVELHKDYMMELLSKYFYHVENRTIGDSISFMRRFCDRYKLRDLDVGYYRTFDSNSVFIETESGTSFNSYWENEKDNLDIGYNMMYVILPLMKLLL